MKVVGGESGDKREWKDEVSGGSGGILEDISGRGKEEREILLVEDDEGHAELIRRIFEERADENGIKWKIKWVKSISEALEYLESGRPSLILADYLLPDGKGLDLTRGAKRPDEMPAPLIIMTAYGSERIAVRSLKSGALDYVVKRLEDLENLPWTAKRALREWENILNRKRAEEELRRKNKELEAFTKELEELVYVISHDLKSPLFSIKSLSQFILEDYSGKLDENALKYLQLIEENAENMWYLIDMLLEVAKVGYLDVKYEEVCVKELVEEIKSSIKGLIISKNAEVKAVCDARLKTSKFFLKTILTNLIVNGIIYNDKERVIVEVRCEEHPEEYLFSVRDNGNGIPAERIPEIFELAHQFRKRTREEEERWRAKFEYVGSGAGLPQCKKMVERLGGKIWVESTVGEGSTFYFTLPKVK
ncbi:MAG: ATP-binding protein [Candidatus Methanospirare jalkutatii]|nr:ATP-binding protein [Candidatus Methanospirare jalkutatii]